MTTRDTRDTRETQRETATRDRGAPTKKQRETEKKYEEVKMKKNLPFFKKNRNLSFASEVFSSNFSVQLGLESGVSLVRLSSVSRLSLVCLSCLSCQGAMERTYTAACIWSCYWTPSPQCWCKATMRRCPGVEIFFCSYRTNGSAYPDCGCQKQFLMPGSSPVAK